MNNFRKYLELLLPVCGDLLLGATKIRRVLLSEVNVPKGAHVMISNSRHAFTASSPQEMRRRCDALLDQTFTYNLFTLNCEHFATFVRYGTAVCNQVREQMSPIFSKEEFWTIGSQPCGLKFTNHHGDKRSPSWYNSEEFGRNFSRRSLTWFKYCGTTGNH